MSITGSQSLSCTQNMTKNTRSEILRGPLRPIDNSRSLSPYTYTESLRSQDRIHLAIHSDKTGKGRGTGYQWLTSFSMNAYDEVVTAFNSQALPRPFLYPSIFDNKIRQNRCQTSRVL